MAFIRKGIFLLCCFTCFCIKAKTQTVYYPAGASSLLKSTAMDVSGLLHRAIPDSATSIQEYASLPASGIIFIYDASITGNNKCKGEGNGSSYLKFSAAGDNGLLFGIYQYLEELGFKFYQPGSIWEIIPSLSTAYKNINRMYTDPYKYRSWFISGGHNRWAMDDNPDYGWDTYYGSNGHNWALYQRRNCMLGSYRFSGHRGDIMTGNYLSTLQQNPCYVACYDGSRTATPQSVPDVNNNASMKLWSDAIEQKYSDFRNIIFGNTGLYADYYRNFDYNYGQIGIEVPDGSRWGNSKDQSGCNGNGYENESNQQFTLAGFTASQLNNVYPGKHLQLYAYSSHADVPSANIPISNQTDIQVVPTAFQNESSAKGLMNRWYRRSQNISEYHYLNIPQWGGETPMFYLSDLKNTLQRLKDNNSQGILWEASPAKFASLPFLWAANRNLVGNKDMDSSLHEFCNNMFGAASGTLFKLLKQWSADNTITVGDFIPDNKYKLPLYFQLVNTAENNALHEAEPVKQRLRELKAYLHYMKLYYDWLFEQDNGNAKTEKASDLCLYLARINKLQLVNSYFLITDIVSRYPAGDPFFNTFNVNNGTAYLNGSLSLISNAEIDANFISDFNRIATSIPVYELADAATITGKIASSDILPAGKIRVSIGYTNGAYYPNRSEFFIQAPGAGNFTINYKTKFNMPGKGAINYTVEAVDKAMEVVKDITLLSNAGEGLITADLPHAGIYKLSVVSKYQVLVDLLINCNGNVFYKNSAFLGNKTENYRADLSGIPGFFYIPQGVQKVFFSINNSNPGGAGFATPKQISDAFVFRDRYGNRVEPELVSADDSALFYLNIPPEQSGSFWQVFKMEQYNLCFANISNMLLYANRKACTKTDFRITVNGKDGNCLTHLHAVTKNSNPLNWEIYDNGRWMYYGNEPDIDLPEYVSPNSYVTLFEGEDCSVMKRLADAPGYFPAREACASGAALPVTEQGTPVFYPNPSAGIYHIQFNGVREFPKEIVIFNSQGSMVWRNKNNNEIDISGQPAGVYLYRLLFNDRIHTGKLIKL